MSEMMAEKLYSVGQRRGAGGSGRHEVFGNHISLYGRIRCHKSLARFTNYDGNKRKLGEGAFGTRR